MVAAGGDLATLAGDPDAVEVRPRTSNPEELQAIIRSATVVVMPSQAEGFGLVATEAGVPVAVLAFTVRDGRITAIDALGGPTRLAGLGLEAFVAS